MAKFTSSEWDEIRKKFRHSIMADTSLVSLAFSPITKALTFKVTNTLGDPRIEPLYVPPFLGSLLNLTRPPKGPKPQATPPPTPP